MYQETHVCLEIAGRAAGLLHLTTFLGQSIESKVQNKGTKRLAPWKRANWLPETLEPPP